MTAPGAGNFGAGQELAGEDAVPPLSPPRNVTPPAAILFNGATFTFPFLPSGLLTPLDPVDQQVALALLIRQGTLASTPALGATFRDIKKIDRTTTNKVNDAVNLALASLLASGAITLQSVTVETRRIPGRILIAVAYRNMRLNPKRPTVVQINLTEQPAPTMPTSLDTTPGEIVVRSRDGIRDQATADYQIRVPSADVGPGTVPYVDASVLADAEMFLVSDAVVIGRGTNLSTSAGAWLLTQGTSRGVEKRPAVGASGFVTVVTSSGGAVIDAGREVKDPLSGLRFTVAATQLYTSSTPVPITGVDTGPATNLATGTAMQFTAPPPGVAAGCTVAYPGLTGGLDADDDATYRILIEETISNPPASGNDAAYQQAIERTPGVGVEKAFTWPAVRGPGTTAYSFTLRGTTTSQTRIPNAAEIALCESYVKGQFPADDGGFACLLLPQAVVVALSVTWAAPAPTWVDVAPWPPYVAGDKVLVDGATLPAVTGCRLTTGTTIATPQIGQTIGFFDLAAGLFRRKRLLTVGVVVAGRSWDVTFDTTNGASDLTYAPVVGTAPSPWSESLGTLVPPLAARGTGYFNTLGPGEQVASFPDPGLRQRRSPASPTAWPNQITTRILAPLFALSSVSDLALLEPATPLSTTVGTPGVLAYLMQLGDLCAFVK